MTWQKNGCVFKHILYAKKGNLTWGDAQSVSNLLYKQEELTRSHVGKQRLDDNAGQRQAEPRVQRSAS